MQQIVQKLVAESVITAPDSAKGKLLAASASLFRQQGYEKTTTRDIANTLGIQSGSLFHHVKSKEEILFTVMQETILLNTERLRHALEGKTAPQDRLKALIRQELQFINGDTGEAMAVLVMEWRALSEEKQQKILELRAIYEQIWLDTLEENYQAEHIPVAPFICRRLLTGTLSWTLNWFKADKTMSLDDLTNEVMKIIIHQK